MSQRGTPVTELRDDAVPLVRPGRRPKAPQPTQRLNVNLPSAVMATLHDLAEANGISLTEAVRRAIQLLRLVDEATRQGREVQLLDPVTNKVQTLQFI